MHLTKLRLYRYRNIREAEIVPSPETNVIYGLNGQGKTNLLESVYLLAYGKSFRTSVAKDCIQHGETECRVSGSLEHGTLTRDLQVSISKSEKKLFVLGKPAPFDEFVGNLHLLAFTHEHLNVVRGGPADRRAFLDRAMVSLYPGHLTSLAAYSRALKQRNRVLSAARDGRTAPDTNLLDSWDEALVRPGARIIANRLRYAEQMKKELPSGLFGNDVLKLHYLSTASGGDPEADVRGIEEQFRSRLASSRTSDLRIGFTTSGPHRDDMKLFVNGKSLSDFGSAGQQRSCLLSLYFSQMEIHRSTHGYYPVFLVDDAEAELDQQRLKTFLDYLAQRTQIFLTSAKEFLISVIPETTARFEVQNGCVIPQPR